MPPVAQAQLRVEVPFGAPDVRVPSALGSSYMDPESGTQHAELGPVKELQLRWPSGTAETPAISPWTCSRHVAEGPAQGPAGRRDAGNADCTCRRPRGPSRKSNCVWTRDLRLVAEPSSPEFEWTEVPAGDPGDVLVTIRLRTPVENELTLHLRFHLTNTTGLGNVSLPRLEAVEGRTTRRSLGGERLAGPRIHGRHVRRARPLDAAEFLTMWGDAESAPNLCYRVSAEDPGWSLATRSRQPRSESRQTVDVSVQDARIPDPAGCGDRHDQW